MLRFLNVSLPLITLFSWASLLHAGPWPRAERDRIAILSFDDQGAALWAESNASWLGWLTVEGRYNYDHSYMVLAALNRSLPDLGPWKMAWSIGARAVSPPMNFVLDMTPVPWPSRKIYRIDLRPIGSARLGFSIGRGLNSPWPGWTATDLSVEYGPLGGTAKADFTLGYRPREGWATIFQLQGIYTKADGAHLAIAPSVTWQMRKGLTLELGLRQPLTYKGLGWKIATWFEF